MTLVNFAQLPFAQQVAFGIIVALLLIAVLILMFGRGKRKEEFPNINLPWHQEILHIANVGWISWLLEPAAVSEALNHMSRGLIQTLDTPAVQGYEAVGIQITFGNSLDPHAYIDPLREESITLVDGAVLLFSYLDPGQSEQDGNPEDVRMNSRLLERAGKLQEFFQSESVEVSTLPAQGAMCIRLNGSQRKIQDPYSVLDELARHFV